MKKHLFLWFLITVLAPLFLAVTSCSSDDDDGPGSGNEISSTIMSDAGLVGMWYGEQEEELESYTFRIFPDGKVLLDKYDLRTLSLTRNELVGKISGDKLNLYEKSGKLYSSAEIVKRPGFTTKYLRFKEDEFVVYHESDDPNYLDKYKYYQEIRQNVSCTVEYEDNFYYHFHITIKTKLTPELKKHTRTYSYAFSKSDCLQRGVSFNNQQPLISVSGDIETVEFYVWDSLGLAALSDAAEYNGDDYKAKDYMDKYAEYEVYTNIYDSLVEKLESGETLSDSDRSLWNRLLSILEEYRSEWRYDLTVSPNITLDGDIIYYVGRKQF